MDAKYLNELMFVPMVIIKKHKTEKAGKYHHLYFYQTFMIGKCRYQFKNGTFT